MFNGTGMFASQGLLLFLAFLPTITYIILTILAIYFTIEVIRFMRKKIKLDKERNEKLDKLLMFGSEGKKKFTK